MKNEQPEDQLTKDDSLELDAPELEQLSAGCDGSVKPVKPNF